MEKEKVQSKTKEQIRANEIYNCASELFKMNADISFSQSLILATSLKISLQLDEMLAELKAIKFII